MSRFRRLGTPQRDQVEAQTRRDSQPEEGENASSASKENDVDVDGLLREIRANDKEAHQDVENSNELINEADRLLRKHKEAEAKEGVDGEDESQKGDDKAEAEIVSSALDEAELDKNEEAEALEDDRASQQDDEGDSDGGLDELISLPSVPSAAPHQLSASVTKDDENDLAARLAALTLPTSLKPHNTSSSSGPQLPDIQMQRLRLGALYAAMMPL